MNKRQIILLIVGIAYVIILGSIVPIMIINLNLFGQIYNIFAGLAQDGFFFLIFLVSTFLFFPFIYSTHVKGKLSFNVDFKGKVKRNPRFYSSILFLIGLPIMIWLIFGILGFYSVTEVSGGLGHFILNGFLVSLIVLFYIVIIPAIVLGLKKNRF
ncbi:MAG: hypothetical protein ACW98D_15645 [Promethearchaeota archaeon]|jgi:hypothetical protein